MLIIHPSRFRESGNSDKSTVWPVQRLRLSSVVPVV
jgi:hypothetical protein